MKAKSIWKTSWPFVQAGLWLGASQSAADSELSSAWNWRPVSSSSSRMRCPTSLSLTASPPTSRLHRLVYRRSPRFDSIQEGEKRPRARSFRLGTSVATAGESPAERHNLHQHTGL